MKSHLLNESTWKEIEKAKIKVALLPWGATEAHNYHLPYGTDTMLSERVASDAAELANRDGAGAIVLPSIAYGVNSGQIEVKLCMNINPSTQMAILSDILFVLESHNIDKLIIVNGHGGNAFQPIIRELSLEYPDTIMCSVNWWKICNENDFFEQPGDHAGELETSCMQAIAPTLVSPLNVAGKGKERLMKIRGFRERWAWTPRRWVYISEDTGVGDPAASTPEKGEKFLECCTKKLAEFIKEFSKVKSEEGLYEQD
ncbi:MAG: amidase [Bacteroidetes bacterium GWF2_41_61]|nr:MAG: amidase [Bacteroidetes bacterium GWF2_41_61]OFY90560.1 MAG: amidase [Bacteroidetes bacterium RIFOXYA12_FULL_40_10]HBG24615.1 amidase [Rikenellaceae bacterium]